MGGGGSFRSTTSTPAKAQHSRRPHHQPRAFTSLNIQAQIKPHSATVTVRLGGRAGDSVRVGHSVHRPINEL